MSLYSHADAPFLDMSLIQENINRADKNNYGLT